VPFLGTIYFNELTNPGYFMGIVWTIFLLKVLFFFREPERVGLHQQKGLDNKTHQHSITPPVKSSASILSKPDEVEIMVTSAAGMYDYGSIEEASNDLASNEDDENSHSNTCCLRVITWPVQICMFFLFVNKLSMESLISSSPIITETRYSWTVKMMGSLEVVIGLLVIPLSIVIGRLSHRFDDARLLTWLLCSTVLGLLLLLDVSDLTTSSEVSSSYGLLEVGPKRYIFGCLLSFSSFQAMESIIMSTLSKVVPYELAAGTCNSGLLNTEVGTFGRAFGDLLVTCIGMISLSDLLDLLVLPLLILIIGCIVLENSMLRFLG